MAKTLFHSSERSNFIVNLKPERLRQLSCRVCMLAMILLTGSMLLSLLSHRYAMPAPPKEELYSC